MTNSVIGHGNLKYYDVDVVVDTSAYASGDLLFDTTQLAAVNVWQAMNRTAILQSIVVLDEDANSKAMDIVFLDDSTSLGTINVAASLDTTDLRNVIGVASVAATDYVDFTATSAAVPQINPFMIRSSNDTYNLYVAGIIRDSATYTATTAIHLQIGLVH